jgi:hypothetical protein
MTDPRRIVCRSLCGPPEPRVRSAAMNATRTLLALTLAAPVVLAGCDRKSDAPAPAASTAPVAPTAATCPAGSRQDGTDCKGAGQARVATLTWNGAYGDSAQVIALKNTSGATLKNGAVALWFYDHTGKRLGVAGGKKYAAPGDAFGTTIKPGETRNLNIGLSKTGLPDGTAEIEAEVVKVTLVNGDGSDGPGWKNDDLNADERVMTGTPKAAVVPPQTAAATLPSRKPATPPPPPPPKHR